MPVAAIHPITSMRCCSWLHREPDLWAFRCGTTASTCRGRRHCCCCRRRCRHRCWCRHQRRRCCRCLHRCWCWSTPDTIKGASIQGGAASYADNAWCARSVAFDRPSCTCASRWAAPFSLRWAVCLRCCRRLDPCWCRCKHLRGGSRRLFLRGLEWRISPCLVEGLGETSLLGLSVLAFFHFLHKGFGTFLRLLLAGSREPG